MTRSRLAVIGSLNIDLTLHVDRLPCPGETVLSSAPSQAGLGGKGGKGGNQAASAAAFGAGVTMTGRVGDDDAGRRIRADLAGRGVDVSQVMITPGARSGGVTIAVDPAGGAGLADAAHVLVAAASLSATAVGARGLLPSREDAESLAARLPVRIVRG